MALKSYKLGELISVYDERNTDNLYNLSQVKGISTEKSFIDTKANLNGVSLTSYKVVESNTFVYVPDTSRRGDKIALALNRDEKPLLVSSIYTTFKCKDSLNLLPEYLFMFFNRPEFDRYARYNSWGSARETFSWEDFCDTEITLPPLSVQKKYVDVYLAMQRNLEAYQSKVEQLKTVCDGYLDRLKKTVSKVRLSDILDTVDKRNTDLRFTEVQGININKSFFPSVAKVDRSSMRNYKIVEPNQFAFSGMQTGRDKCIRIALNENPAPLIVSPAYTTLAITTSKVLSRYILLWFSRKEIDRYGWFASDASIRSNLDLDRFLDMKIPLPSTKIQQEIVNIHKCYLERQRIAEELKKQINRLCPVLIRGSLQDNN